ncbi:hypothetical protein [Streptomonospora wellingtoniae]|uniref:Ribosomal protein L7/L12 C-terminal domain-containing protein n=1 Tax=Streptomonospora wellingtoniae TaxID=3075544 RepID=A0ABU2KMU8_9ACTN|nr:hypothetical protein [Streptomonospora sp. DSM 45055]MDT0300591.1 hypothetical protein [Streptomonospora sp. DSM 45055]
MSMVLMVLAMLGALAVLGLGSWVSAHVRRGRRDIEPGADAHGAAAPDEAPVGGYTLLEGSEEDAGRELAGDALARVRGLLAEGRDNEAVGAVRDATGCSALRAEEIVAGIRRPGQ